MTSPYDEGVMSRNVHALIRFSYLSNTDRGYGNMVGMSLEDRARMLFDPVRLEARFALFEAVCLPSLAAQNPDRFDAMLLSSAALPDRWKERLEGLLADHPNISARYDEPDQHSDAFTRALAERFDTDHSKSHVRATVRLDDDDALSADFSDRIQPFVKPGLNGFALTFPKGYLVDVRQDPIMVSEHEKMCHSLGLAFMSARPWKKHIYNVGPHLRTAEFVPTVVDAKRPMFVRLLHAHNASKSKPLGHPSRGKDQKDMFVASDAALARMGGGRFAFLKEAALREARRLALAAA
jgi:hypothetical protein